MRIVVAMSGGVDSSVAAALLAEAGHEVIGLSMKTHSLAPKSNRACCTPDDMRDARAVADQLGIRFYVLNYEELFRREVVEPFAKAYRAGQTPNPCVACNDKVKFSPLLERAKLLGADLLATGHYARLVKDADRVRLLRAVDGNKDQSYFLYRLEQQQLQSLMFPLGHMTKDQVRAEARRLGLNVADKRESQEICFVGPEGYAKTVEKIDRQPANLGEQTIVDSTGKVVGSHDGVHHFTWGQRRGLKIAASEPMYVTDLDAKTGRVHVGQRADLLAHKVTLKDVHWVGDAPAQGAVLGLQQRYRETPKRAQVGGQPSPTELVLTFDEPTMHGAPGQAAVLYRDDEVVGGGTLVRRARLALAPDPQPEPAMAGS